MKNLTRRIPEKKMRSEKTRMTGQKMTPRMEHKMVQVRKPRTVTSASRAESSLLSRPLHSATKVFHIYGMKVSFLRSPYI